jgi:hypothetical protein
VTLRDSSRRERALGSLSEVNWRGCSVPVFARVFRLILIQTFKLAHQVLTPVAHPNDSERFYEKGQCG